MVGEGGRAAKGRGGTTRVAAPDPRPPFSLLLGPHPPRPAQVRRARPRRLHAARRHDPHDEPAQRRVGRERGAHPDGARRVSQHICGRAVGRRARARARARTRAPRVREAAPRSTVAILAASHWPRPRGGCKRRSSAGARMVRSFPFVLYPFVPHRLFSTLSSPTLSTFHPFIRARCADPLATHVPCETFSWTPPPPISLLHRRWHPHTSLRSRGLNTTARPDAVSASVCAQWC